MQIVPLQPKQNQRVQTTLGEQIAQFKVRQTRYGMFISVYLDDDLVIGGVVCENLNRIVRDEYFGFSGDVAFIDTQGSADPTYDGLGSRFLLAYMTAAELAAAGVT